MSAPMSKLCLSRALCLALTLLWLRGAPAHVTTYTGAERSSTVVEVWIEAERITLRLEIGERDREAFAALLGADEADASRDLVLTGDGGAPLAGDVKIVERRPRTERSTAPQATKRPMITYVEKVYELAAPPATLTLTPPMQDSGEAAAEIGFIAHHASIPVIDFQYLRQPETLRLDWGDPWYSAFENPELKRHHRAPLMTFLYIEPYEVRFEILVRLKSLASWISLDAQALAQIDAASQAQLRERIGQFFMQQSPVRLDGAAARPLLDRAAFVKMTPQGIQPLEAGEPLTWHTALVGVILTYITPGLPQEVTADWPLFDEQITSIPSTIIDPVAQLPYDLTPAQPTLRWTNVLDNYNYQAATIDAIAAEAAEQLDIPLPSLLLCLAAITLVGVGRRLIAKRAYRLIATALLLVIAAALWPFGRVAARNPFIAPYQLPDIEAILILQELLQNTYRAFDFRLEQDIYDKLALSVAGDLISGIYLQNRQRLVMEEQGGARAKVEDVQLLDAAPSGLPDRRQRLTFQCVWRITGTVNHWGHSHQRRNQYEANITIQPIERAWKMVALDLIDERRLP